MVVSRLSLVLSVAGSESWVSCESRLEIVKKREIGSKNQEMKKRADMVQIY